MKTMTVEKAIEILSEAAYHGSMTLNEDFKDALKVAIKVLVKHRSESGEEE